MWSIIKAEKLPTEGINHWVYSGGSKVFVGVALTTEDGGWGELEKRQIRIEKYVLWKHRGSFSDIPEGYRFLEEEIRNSGKRPGKTSLEIYGHVSDTDPQSEMEILIEVE
jgi:predicted transcriptional regulator YdeE